MEAEVINAQLPERVSYNENLASESFVKAPDFREVIAEAIKTLGAKGSKAAVARRLGVSRAYVSRVMSEGVSRYEPPQKFITKVYDRLYMVTTCPHTGQPQPFSECRALALAPAPTHNPMRMAIWKSCQRCPNKPIKE